jgi:hypothetical protein
LCSFVLLRPPSPRISLGCFAGIFAIFESRSGLNRRRWFPGAASPPQELEVLGVERPKLLVTRYISDYFMPGPP